MNIINNIRKRVEEIAKRHNFVVIDYETPFSPNFPVKLHFEFFRKFFKIVYGKYYRRFDCTESGLQKLEKYLKMEAIRLHSVARENHDEYVNSLKSAAENDEQHTQWVDQVLGLILSRR